MRQPNFYLSSSLLSKELELKKLPFGIIYVKDKHLIIYFYIMPGNFSLLAQRKVAEKESALVRALLRDFYFKKIVFYL